MRSHLYARRRDWKPVLVGGFALMCALAAAMMVYAALRPAQTPEQVKASVEMTRQMDAAEARSDERRAAAQKQQALDWER